jgi:toxin ParE1/3/4
MQGTSGWVIRPVGQADLADIWQRGVSKLGFEQADRYADGQFALFDLLVEFPEIARERAEFLPPVRIHPSGEHMVIYRHEGQVVEIIRILHTHQNLTACLLDN